MTANLAFGAFLLLMALVLAVVGWRMLQTDRTNLALSKASSGWAQASGRIDGVDVEVTKNASYDSNSGTDIVTNSYEPRVAYSYETGGKVFVGSRIAFGRMQFRSEKPARARVAAWKAGDSVIVNYDPADPQTSVLDRDTKAPAVSMVTMAMLIGSVFFGVMGVVMASLA